MKITKVKHASAPLTSTMSNAVINFSAMTTNVVCVETDVVRNGKPVIGFGASSNGRYAQPGLLESRFLPRLHDADPKTLLDETGENFSPQAIWKTLMSNEKPGGHGERSYCIGALDTAIWDLHGKIAEKPLWKVFSEKYNGGKYDEKVLVYPGGGYYYPGKDVEKLREEMRGYREQGFRIAKMKVGAVPLADDMKRVEAAADELGSGENLAVDVNGAFTLEQAIAFGKAVEPLKLAWYEEPGDPLDYHLNAELIQHYPHAIATGENLFSHQDMTNLLRFGGMRPGIDLIEPDPTLCYGPTEMLVMLEQAANLGWDRRSCLPHGGHQIGLHMACGLQLGGTETYPGVHAPFGGFADDATFVDGYTTPSPDQPGLGIEYKAALMDTMRNLLELN